MQLRFFNKDGSHENKFHFHEPLEILLIMSEGDRFIIQDKMYPITRGMSRPGSI